MKSLLSGLLLFAAAGTAAAQCTPDQFVVMLGVPGVYPVPTQQDLDPGSVGQAYSETITIVTLADTTFDFSPYVPFSVPPVTVSVLYQKVNNISGLPSGLNYACNVSGCSVPGDSSGCVGITGTPTQGGVFPVTMETVIGLVVPAQLQSFLGQTFDVPVPGLGWDMEVAGGTGIEELDRSTFSVAQNGPNPFSGTTTIYFTSVRPAKMTLTVRDLAGRALHTEDVRAQAGENAVEFDATGLAAGTYFYSLDNGTRVITHKMVVTE